LWDFFSEDSVFGFGFESLASAESPDLDSLPEAESVPEADSPLELSPEDFVLDPPLSLFLA
jgi:hypothetical protein